MNNLKKLKLELVKMLANFSEFETDKGPLYSENDWITATVPVYVFTEDGELVPAPDGEYNTPETITTYKQKEIYVVVDGIVTEVKSVNSKAETSTASTETEEVVAEMAEEVVTETTTEIPAEEDPTTKLIQMVKELVDEVTALKSEMEVLRGEFDQLKSDVIALTTSMANLSEQRRTVIVNDKKNTSKEINPIFSI